MLVFDTRGMRRYFDLQVLKQTAAFEYAHLLIRTKANAPFLLLQILLERPAQKGAISQGQEGLTEGPGARLTFEVVFN